MAPSIANGSSNGYTNEYANGHVNGHSNGNSNGYIEPFDLSTRLTVNRSSKAFSSYAVSLVDLSAGSLFAPILGTTPAAKAYSSVQTGPDSHIELNSELVFCNHSCDPSVTFDPQRLEVRVVCDRDLRAGEKITFWYPSTEWNMDQKFECTCGSEKCKGWISGAGQMDENVVREYWLSDHIEKLLMKRSQAKQARSG